MIMLTSNMLSQNETGNILQSIAEKATEIDEIVGVMVLIAGAVVGLLNAGASFLAITLSYNIEIALMTKKEQWKYNIANSMIPILAMWILNTVYGIIFKCAEDVPIDLFALLLVFAICIMIILLLVMFFKWCAKKLYDIHFCRAICLVIKRGISKISERVCHVLSRIKCGMSNLIVKIGDWKYAKKLRVKINGNERFKKIKEKIRKIKDFMLEIWASSAKEKVNSNVKTNKNDMLKLIAFVDIWGMGILLNCSLAIYAKTEYNVLIGSTLITLLAFEVSTLFITMGVKPGEARIYYYDALWGKDIFVYFRYDENHCIAGDNIQMAECKEYYLLTYDRIQTEKILLVSQRISYNLQVNNKRIKMQTIDGEFILQDMLDKVQNELKSKNLTLSEVEKTDIYIKPADKKAYYVVSDETRGTIDL